MKKNIPAILTAIIAVAIVAVVAVIIVKAGKNSGTVDEFEKSAKISAVTEKGQSEYYYDTEASFFDYGSGEPSVDGISQESTTLINGETINGTTAAAEDTSDTTTDTDSTGKSTSAKTVTEKVTALTTVVNTKFSELFTMPKVPKYIPPDIDIDFSKASIASYKYDPEGNYYYTDDKNAWQKGFGYTKIYDNLAIATAMYYDTVRTTFTYGGKDWLLQIWKGQYGYYFVGEEIGIYTKTQGSKSGTYACADKSDWVKMEMCFLWDENDTGTYTPIFSRPYTDYWWCTGFVVGFESEKCIKTREQFRMVAHITFKDTEMATLFSNAFEKNGFKRVSKLDNNTVDTFVQSGADVAFVWQNINQHVI